MMREEGFEFGGFMSIMLVGGALMYAVKASLEQPDVVKNITAINPWIGNHASVLSWIAVGIIFSTVVAIPPLLMSKAANGGENVLVKIGMTAWAIIIVFAAFFLLPSLGFLLGVGWFSAKQIIGF